MPVTTTFVTTATPTIVIGRGTASTTSTLFLSSIFRQAPSYVSPMPVVGYAVTNTTAVISNTVTNYLVSGIRSFYDRSITGYGLNNYFTLPVNSSTRILAKTYNSMLSDLDLVYRHITSASIVSTVTNLSTFTHGLVINTGTAVTSTQWQSLVNRLESLQLNRFNVNPGQLANDGACDIVYDQSVSTRTRAWGTGTETSVSMTVEVEWPRSFLANSFFNLGSELTFSPFWPSMTLIADTSPSSSGLVNYGFRTALDTFVSVPLSVYGNGSGRGPVYHVNYGLHPYGAVRTPGSTDYFYEQYGTPTAVSGDAGLLSQSPNIQGTPFQLVGLHYGDYTTQLVIGVQQGQTVPTGSTQLLIYLNGNSSTSYTATVPGYLGKYTGPNGGSLNGLNGWWTWDGVDDLQYSWIEIYSGRKGQDPIGLASAIASRTLNTISLIPTGTVPGSSVASASTITNAWAQFVTRLNQYEAKNYTYGRDKWMASNQTTVTVFTSTLALNTMTVSISATRDQVTPGQSRRLVFTMTATNISVGSRIVYESPYTYVTSTNTCNNIITVGNVYDGSSQTDYQSGGSTSGGGSFPWWIVAVGFFGSLFSVICVKLADLGLLDWDIIEGDRQFGQILRQTDPDAIKGYHSWAWWVIDWMDGTGPRIPFVSQHVITRWSRSWALAIAKPAALEMAHRVGHRSGKTSWFGRQIINWGIKFNSRLGKRLGHKTRLEPTTTNIALFLIAACLLRITVALTYRESRNSQYVEMRTN